MASNKTQNKIIARHRNNNLDDQYIRVVDAFLEYVDTVHDVDAYTSDDVTRATSYIESVTRIHKIYSAQVAAAVMGTALLMLQGKI